MTKPNAPDCGDQAYIDRARADPACKKIMAAHLLGLGFHLWEIPRSELANVTVSGLRASRHLQHGYITDAEIGREIEKARSRVFIPLADSRPFMGACGDWHSA